VSFYLLIKRWRRRRTFVVMQTPDVLFDLRLILRLVDRLESYGTNNTTTNQRPTRLRSLSLASSYGLVLCRFIVGVCALERKRCSFSSRLYAYTSCTWQASRPLRFHFLVFERAA
jgi:hypothetical protein